jgi:hypothetical protein
MKITELEKGALKAPSTSVQERFNSLLTRGMIGDTIKPDHVYSSVLWDLLLNRINSL